MRLCNMPRQENLEIIIYNIKEHKPLHIKDEFGLTVIHPSDQMVSTLVIVAKQGEAFFPYSFLLVFFKRLDQKAKNKNASLRLSFKEPLMWPIYCLSQVKLMTNAYSFKSVTCRKSWLAWLGSGGRVGKGYWWSWNQMPEIFNILCLDSPELQVIS